LSPEIIAQRQSALPRLPQSAIIVIILNVPLVGIQMQPIYHFIRGISRTPERSVARMLKEVISTILKGGVEALININKETK
jgi:hypothetical protein